MTKEKGMYIFLAGINSHFNWDIQQKAAKKNA